MNIGNKTAREYLENELGELYRDIIEIEWDCSVDEFVEEYLREDQNGDIYSLV